MKIHGIAMLMFKNSKQMVPIAVCMLFARNDQFIVIVIVIVIVIIIIITIDRVDHVISELEGVK